MEALSDRSAEIYQKIIEFYISGQNAKPNEPPLAKKDLEGILLLAQSDRERKILKYTAFKSSGLSATAARKYYGFQDLKANEQKILSAIEEVKEIRSSVHEWAMIKDKAFLLAHNLPTSETSTSGSDEDSGSEEPTPLSSTEFSSLPLQAILTASKSNFFQVAEDVERHIKRTLSSEESDKLFQHVESLREEEVPGVSLALLQESYRAFVVSSVDSIQSEKDAAMVNGEIVTDSESDNAEDYITKEKTELVVKYRKILKRKTSRLIAQKIASRRILARQTSKKVRGLLAKFPNIGKDIEKFVSDRNVGADHWRRTGVLTFDGNRNIKEKVTYERIRQHLQELYKCHFSYGTVVQCCVPRNKRRRSAQNYRGVAQVTTRRARKGFTLKYNPDHHWSSAFYQSLNWLQMTDGRSLLIVNRDDASGFRLDTMATCHQYATPSVESAVTVRTDFVNKYSSILQTSSYNFTATETTIEMCAGIVKPASVYPKNPAQHFEDFTMLSGKQELAPAFVDEAGKPKNIVCIRVDGAGDEGPSHHEVQFWWCLHHFEAPTTATLVTARSSGSSYLNRVELQNGSLSKAHANLFIPSTLNGSSYTGSKVDESKLKANLMAAANVYIKRCDGAPCGDATIHLYKGADSTSRQATRSRLLTFLKGTNKQKAVLKQEHPNEYELFTKVWSIRERHVVQKVPFQYAFFLYPCYELECPHPVCKQGKPLIEPTWFQGGPPLSYLPLPVVDTTRPWGNLGCPTCSQLCCGHYLKPNEAYKQQHSVTTAQPPSQILYEEHKCNPRRSNADIAKAILLSTDDVELWFEHLTTVKENREAGAKKAAETRKKKSKTKKSSEPGEWRCGTCGRLYEEETEEEEVWIECSTCKVWLHLMCTENSEVPDTFICQNCNV